MGIPLDIFDLYGLQKEDRSCLHYLLLRVERAGFNNADEGEYDRVVEAADSKKKALIERYIAEILAHDCAGSHAVTLLGAMETSPVGEALCQQGGGFYVDLWIAETKFGYPWVVMGTAETAAAFWQGVEQSQDLSRLGAIEPVSQQRVFFLTDGS